MVRKIIITERQASLIKSNILENKDYDSILTKILGDINTNYEPELSTYRKGGEYFEKPMIKIKADGELITPKDLLHYLKFKYKINDGFLRQVILDWINGDIKDNKLTKNVSFN